MPRGRWRGRRGLVDPIVSRETDSMSLDDDADCVEHVWGLAELVLSLKGAETVSTCVRCGAVSYAPSDAANDPNRPRL